MSPELVVKRSMQRISSLLCGGALATALVCHAAPPTRAQIPTPRATEAVSSQDESFPSLQRRLADAIAKGDRDQAIAIAERQHTLFPEEMKATADLGDAYLTRGDAERAEPLLRAAITQPSRLYTNNVAPVLGTIYANLGQIALARGQAKEAITHLQRAVDYAPTAARARFMLASAFAVTGDADRSLREIRAAFDIDRSAAQPDDYLLLARALNRSGNVTAAIDAMESAVKRYPFDADMRIELAAMLRAGRRSTGALCELLYAQMLIHPGDPHAPAIADGIAQIRAELDVATPEPPPDLEMLFSYLDDASTGQYDEALPTIQEVVGVNPSAFVPRLLLGHTYAATGRLGAAEALLTRLVVEDPSSVPALAELANLYFTQQRADSARRIIDQALKLDPENPRLREVVEAWKE